MTDDRVAQTYIGAVQAIERRFQEIKEEVVTAVQNQTLGGQLRNLRKLHNQTLDEAAAACGISVSHLSEIERGVNQPSVETLRALALYYGASIDVLLGMPQFTARWDGSALVFDF